MFSETATENVLVRSGVRPLAGRKTGVLWGGGRGGVPGCLGAAKQFGFGPKRLKSLNSWNTFAWLRLPLAWLRLPGPLADFPLAWTVVQPDPLMMVLTMNGARGKFITKSTKFAQRTRLTGALRASLVFIVVNSFDPLAGPGMSPVPSPRQAGRGNGWSIAIIHFALANMPLEADVIERPR
jgi:hypothetical protein